jgi:hypothetical protein
MSAFSSQASLIAFSSFAAFTEAFLFQRFSLLIFTAFFTATKGSVGIKFCCEGKNLTPVATSSQKYRRCEGFSTIASFALAQNTVIIFPNFSRHQFYVFIYRPTLLNTIDIILIFIERINGRSSIDGYNVNLMERLPLVVCPPQVGVVGLDIINWGGPGRSSRSTLMFSSNDIVSASTRGKRDPLDASTSVSCTIENTHSTYYNFDC